MWKLLLLAVVTCAVMADDTTLLSDAASTKGGGCITQSPLVARSGALGAGVNIFPALSVHCNTPISAWAFYASAPGAFYAGIWRLNILTGQYVLVGKNRVVAQAAGSQVLNVPEALRIKGVLPGDVMGIHFATPADAAASPVALYDAAAPDAANPVDASLLSSLLLVSADDATLKEGAAYPATDLSKLVLPNMYPIFELDKVRLEGGRSANEGRALFRKGDEFGTICDTNTAPSWPHTLCREAGYDHAEAASLLNNTYVSAADPKMPVNMMNPVCTSDDVGMATCAAAAESSAACGHEDDFFVSCGDAIKLAGGKDASEGVPMIFAGGVWAPVCDTSLAPTWPMDFCRQLGYDHVSIVMPAAESHAMLPEMTQAPALMNPLCPSGDGVNMKECTNQTPCTSNNIQFIQCNANIRLGGTDSRKEGRAEYYNGTHWGTICDADLASAGWPDLMCMRMGFAGVYSAGLASKEISLAPTTLPVTMKSPHCTAEDTIAVHACTQETECDHNTDVYIVCRTNNRCESSPCQHGALCQDYVNDYRCVCKPGFIGTNCETNVDECASNPCTNGATCEDQVNGYRCHCPTNYKGTNCMQIALPVGSTMLSPAGSALGLAADFSQALDQIPVTLAAKRLVLSFVDCLSGREGYVSVQAANFPSYHLVAVGDQVVFSNDALTMGDGACFLPIYAKPSNTRIIRLTTFATNIYLCVPTDGSTVKLAASGTIIQTTDFEITDVDGVDGIKFFKNADYEGASLTVTHDDDDLIVRNINRARSFIVTGRSSWQVYSQREFSGLSVIASPGIYNEEWIAHKLGTTLVGSVKVVERPNSLTLFKEAGFDGEYETLQSQAPNLAASSFGTAIQSVTVTGPNSWEMYKAPYYRGDATVLAPGQYDADWLSANFNGPVVSARQVAANQQYCALPTAMQEVVGMSGATHRAFVVKEEDGTLWFRFGMSGVTDMWNKVNEDEVASDFALFTDHDIAAMKDFNFEELVVDSDLKFLYMVEHSSWHPSYLDVMFLQSRKQQKISILDNMANDHTHLTFTGDHSRLTCNSGGALRSSCGAHGAPESGQASDPLVILKAHFDPRGNGAHANNKWSSNRFTFSGSKYLVYAKIADCYTSKSCFLGKPNVNYIQSVKNDDLLVFGSVGNDEQACQDACSNQQDCVAYTHFITSYAEAKKAGHCFGIPSRLGGAIEELNSPGATSGVVAPCAGFIPSFLKHDVYTQNGTLCACNFDPTRSDCACCEDGGCQCGERYQYQCVRCGFQHQCGRATVREENGDYTFEDGQDVLAASGDHFQIPETCVTKCSFEVDAMASNASRVSAVLQDTSDKTRLSCTADTNDHMDQDMRIEAYPDQLSGVRISSIHLYAFGGIGVSKGLRLSVNTAGCPEEPRNERYAGCFHKEDNMQFGSGIPVMDSPAMKPDLCSSFCLTRQYKYAGTFGGRMCTCSNQLPSLGMAYTCSQRCAGDDKENCGGDAALSVFQTTKIKRNFNFFTTSACDTLGANTLAMVHVNATAASCRALTPAVAATLVGQADTAIVSCPVTMCNNTHVTPGGVYVAKPGSCPTTLVAQVQFTVLGKDCTKMGGRAYYDQTSWGPCTLDMCTAVTPDDALFVGTGPGQCKKDMKMGQTFLLTSPDACSAIGGANMGNPMGGTDVNCGIEYCSNEFSGHKDSTMWHFPNPNLSVPGGTTSVQAVAEMCVTECQILGESLDDPTLLTATFASDGGKEVNLLCQSNTTKKGLSDDMSFSDPPAGVKVKNIKLTAQGGNAALRYLKLRVAKDGCKDQESYIALYKGKSYSGKPEIIKEDMTELAQGYKGEINSAKVFGTAMWQVFSAAGYKGESVVLNPGHYEKFDDLPVDSVSSVKIINQVNMPRSDISNNMGTICFQRQNKVDMLFGLVSWPGTDNRPNTFYFGVFGDDDEDACEQACRKEASCSAYTHFLSKYKDPAWRGGCYGRNVNIEVNVQQEDVVSGTVADCNSEDTFTLFTEKAFKGELTTLVENMVNLTNKDTYGSLLVSGADTWRVTSMGGGFYHTNYFPPGKYEDLTLTLHDYTIVQVFKMHPKQQLYVQQHFETQVKLAPVASNQIQEIFYKIPDNTEPQTNNAPAAPKKDCTTTEKAEVVFLIDASSSVGTDNYNRVLQFAANISTSFAVAADKVRVAAVVFSHVLKYDLKLTQFDTNEDISDALTGLTYYHGSTYTHAALKMAREQVLDKDIVRAGIPKIIIVITDGRSRWPSMTKKEAHTCRDDGIAITAVGIKHFDYTELMSIAGDQSRIFNVTDFSMLGDITELVTKTTCKMEKQTTTVKKFTEYKATEVQGNDEAYFLAELADFKRRPNPLGMEIAIIEDEQIFASSAMINYDAFLARLNGQSGWVGNTPQGVPHDLTGAHWIEADLGSIVPVHGLAVQGHGSMEAWVTQFKLSISLDSVTFSTLTAGDSDLIFNGNVDTSSLKHHCLHRLFGVPVKTRIVRFVIVSWHIKIALRFELYGYRSADDQYQIAALTKDVWTRTPTGCPCYWDPRRTDCACCEAGACQCSKSDKHQCVQCGYPHNCGKPSLRNPVDNVDGWTSAQSGCRCVFNPLRMDCACCQNHGCQCGEHVKNQCVNCGHPENCGEKEAIFGPNAFCVPKTCPRQQTAPAAAAPSPVA